MTRVLVLEDDRSYERLLATVVAGEGGPYQVECAHTMAEALSSIYLRPPEVVLLDLDLPDSTGYATFQRVRRTAKEACIIVLTACDDERLAVRAVHDGAQDYLVKSLTQPHSLTRTIRIALEREQRRIRPPEAPLPGTVWGFIGSKGGVGASTLSLNVAAALTAEGSRAFFMDLQPGPGMVARFMGTPPNRDFRALLEKPAGVLTLADLEPWFHEPVHGFRIFHIAGSTEPWRPLGAAYVKSILSLARGTGARVILDLGSRVDESTAEALRNCDGIVLVVDREPASLWCGAAVLRQIESLVPTDPARVSVVLVDRSQPFGCAPAEDILKQLRMVPAAAIASAAGSVEASHVAGVPVALLDPQGGYARSVRQLIERLPSQPLSATKLPLALTERRACTHEPWVHPLLLGSGLVD